MEQTQGVRMTSNHIVAWVAIAFALAAPAVAQDKGGTIERLYVMECGQGRAPDQGRWSPGVNEGKPFDMVTNCYLIRHAQGWMIWETGVGDTFASLQEGRVGQQGAPSWTLAKTLLSQLDEIGVRPSDIRYVAVSHTHGDHIGNVELFPKAMLLVQKAEYEWPNPLGVGRFKLEHPVTKLEGDRDVFGDGSVIIVSTPGHTPGHQSILIKLPKRRDPDQRRRRSLQGQLGQPPRSRVQRRQGKVAGLDAAHGRSPRPAQGAALDPPRPSAERRPEKVAGLLRLGVEPQRVVV